MRGRKAIKSTMRRLSPDGFFWQPEIDSEGRAVLYWGTEYETSGYHVWIARLSDNSPMRLTEPGSFNGHPSWCPDGRHFVYFTSVRGEEADEWDHSNQFQGNRPASNLWIMDAETKRRRQLTHGEYVDERPVVSPCGKEVVFVSNRAGPLNLWAVGFDGDDLRQVTDETEFAYRPVFSPEGERIAYFTGDEEGGHRVRIRSWPSGEEIPYRLRRSFAWMHGPYWSGDGKFLLFHGLARGDHRHKLWLLELQSGRVRPLKLPGVASCSHGSWDRRERWLSFDSSLRLTGLQYGATAEDRSASGDKTT